MQKRLLIACSSTIVAAFMTVTFAQTPASSSSPPKPTTSQQASTAKAATNPDATFVKDAAVGGMAEVELGQLAADKAASEKVKTFGRMMVTDHGKANEELKNIAASKSIALPTTLDAKHTATKDRLSKLEGDAFDKAYINEMVTGHETTVAMFRREASSGKDAEVKAFASKTLPTLDQHLKAVQEIQKEVNGAKPTATSGQGKAPVAR
jgi:putative membrane protein